ncbi:hypothetical protein BV25DRAFT_1804489 [Artomyces pyxidatus]|uniref:Uncharacterized protein n=1 Tax=Artomyces pyxidatus TaxID=48021 RepID=A0ACB8T020_9AGAM|nr:hypothetical protein BV25DRAFT_1804489 [Artomyces pyxidatus]
MLSAFSCRSLPYSCLRSAGLLGSTRAHLGTQPWVQRHLLPCRNISSSSHRHAQYSRFSEGPGKKEHDRSGKLVGRIFVVLGASGLVYYVSHLERVPETGRLRFIDMSAKAEAALWEASAGQILQQYRGQILPPDHPLTRHIHSITNRLLSANNLGRLKSSEDHRSPPVSASDLFGGGDESHYSSSPMTTAMAGKEWNLFVVHDTKEVNAMATPGSIIVFTGIIPIARNDDGLAAILSHEIGHHHVVARHSVERYSYTKILIAIMLLMQTLDYGLITSNVITYLLELPNSRTHELEADTIGLRVAAKACFDPAAAPAMFRRLGALEEKQGRLNVDFLYTHPTSETRVKRLEAQLPGAQAIQAATDCGNLEGRMSAFQQSFARW